MSKELTKWEVGEKVAYYGPYARRAEKVLAIEKIYKTGHVVIGSVRYGISTSDCAYQTGSSWSRSHIAKLTPERQAEIVLSRKIRFMQEAAEWLRKAKPEDVPTSLVDELVDLMNQRTPSPQEVKT